MQKLHLQQDQDTRTQKHIALDEIGRRFAIGDFKELNVSILGDIDRAVQALSDSLQKWSANQSEEPLQQAIVGLIIIS